MIIDLTKREPGCIGHPVMRLNRKLREARGYDEVKIIFNVDDLPIDAAEILVRRHGFKVKDREQSGKTCVLYCIRGSRCP